VKWILSRTFRSLQYFARTRKFREKLEGWLKLVRAMWPGCPAGIAEGGSHLLIDEAFSVLRPTFAYLTCAKVHLRLKTEDENANLVVPEVREG
jgi:hypothetical protein